MWASCIAAIIDSGLTYVGLRWLGGEEGSSAVQQLIDSLGLLGGLAVRALIVFALVFLLWRVVTIASLRVLALIVVAMLNVAVIGWNLAVMW